MTQQIGVALGERAYTITIADGLIGSAVDYLERFSRGDRLVVVSDENVWAALGLNLERGLRLGNIQAVPIILQPGEGSKDWQTLASLIDRLLTHGVERGDTIVAFGGGMIGDLSGFAAAILKRGCNYVQIPTSLLAQVDSSVGGKTAINTTHGKNLVGAFHQPSAVLIDPSALDTLPDRELRAGYAEVVKYGLIGNADFFAWCEETGSAVLARDRSAPTHAIERCVRAKAEIVAADERELGGKRALLNFGHTFGHALEAVTGFSDRLLHGEAVAAGMALAFRFSAARGLCPAADADRVARHLDGVGLPTGLAGAGVTAEGKALTQAMVQDKKRAGGRLPFILSRGIGRAFVADDVELAEVAAFLDDDRG